MMKKIIAIALETIPVLSTVMSFMFILIPYGSEILSYITPVTVFLAFFGFVFFFIGRKLCNDDKTVRVLGILDLVSTISIIVLYIISIFSFGL